MPENLPIPSPTLAQEQERLRKWREVRRQAAADPNTDRLRRADQDRQKRLDLFESDKADRIRNAETRRRVDAEVIEARRMDKACAHLEALDDIETARAALLSTRRKMRIFTSVMLAIFVGLPTVITAVFYMFIVTPVFHSTSVLALDRAIPMAPRNPLYNNMSGQQISMAAAFQLRVKLQAQGKPEFEMAVDTGQGLLTLTTYAPTPTLALSRNTTLIGLAAKHAFPGRLTVLAKPNLPDLAEPKAFPNTLLTFFISLTLFIISAIFFQSFRHYARN